MNVKIHQIQPDRLTVELEGPFTIETVPVIRREILKQARKRGIRSIDIDFSGVSSVDTAGIAVLVELLRVLSRRQVELRLSGLSDNTRRMLHLARLEQTFELNQSVKELD